MSGIHITSQQESIYMKERNSGETQELSAAKSGMSVSSGYRTEKGLRQPKKPRTHRTRKDPLSDIWESELIPLLDKEPTLSGLTLWEHLDDNFPEEYSYGLLRTLQRRVADYKLEYGPSQDVIFRQSFPAGVQGMSDFTHPDTKITIAGVEFKHIIYQFVLTHSHHRYAQVMQGGESFSALSEGLQNAFAHIGGVPQESKTDSLSAAFKNAYEEKTLTDNYNKLCQHYGLKAIRNTKGVSHENGSVETANRALKHRIDQAMKLRGSNDFATIQDYQKLIDAQVKRLNKRSVSRFAKEQKALRPLPKYRFMDYEEIATKVTTSSTITIKRTLYSVPSKLIGANLKILLYHDKLECYVGTNKITTLARVYTRKDQPRARLINYKHIIDSLVKKPQAFRYSQLQEDLFPSELYKQLWKQCNEQLDSHSACKWMVSVLKIASMSSDENVLAQSLLAMTKLPTTKTLQDKYLIKRQVAPDIVQRQHDLKGYDGLIKGTWSHSGNNTGAPQ